MLRHSGLVLVALSVLLLACEAEPGGYDYHSGPDGEGGVDAVVVDDVVGPGKDTLLTDSVGPGEDSIPAEDTTAGEDVTPGEDTEADVPAPPECGDVVFSYTGAVVSEVLVTGEFTGWAESAAAGAHAMSDDDGDGTWEVPVHLEPGSYQYKLIVDGSWITDPSNPSTVDDGQGNTNSLIVVDCSTPAPGSLVLVSHDTVGDTFHAVFEVTEGAVSPSDIGVTVDDGAAPAGAVSVSGGGAQVDLELTGLAEGIHDVRVTDPDGAVLLLKVYVGVSTDWRDVILYFVMTDRFVNGDPSNDGPIDGCDWRTNYQGGDFQGITGKIESGYFDDLGVGALWLTWPVDNPEFAHDGGRPAEHYCGMNPKTANYTGTQYSGFHGYWPQDLYEVEEHFGTMAELKALVNTAHAHGIRILLDFTANHVHTSSPFYQEHQDDGFFHFPVEICQDVGWDNKPVTCWFTDYLADLNYSNPAAVDAVLDYAMYWAKETGSDGFRLDAVKHIEFNFISALRSRAKAEMELTGVDFYIVGETFTGDAGLIEDFIGPDKIHGQFDFPANLEILQGFAKEAKGLDEMDQAIRAAKGTYGAGAIMSNFLGNHDIARFVSMASGGIDCGVWDVVSNIAQGWLAPPEAPTWDDPYEQLRLAFTYLMTIPGVPLIYYGDEYGMPGAGDPDNRRMMQFGGDLNGQQQATLQYLAVLGQVRNAHLALSRGDWSPPLWAEGDFIAYARTLPVQKAVVLINRGAAPKSGQLDLGPAGIGDGAVLTDVLNGGSSTVLGGTLAFTCPARSAAIYVTP
ncbi:MAG: alpha-amylase family glycosyl hydrolase [Pseudomonadota bacterium]